MRANARSVLMAATVLLGWWASGAAVHAAPPDQAAAQIPDDIWSGRHGGNPAITVSRHRGSITVSVVIPGPLLDGKDQKSVTMVVKQFLERYGPPMCTDLIDLTVPHKNLVVELGVQELSWSLFRFNFYEVSRSFGKITFDYQPAVQMRCVERRPPTS